MPSALVKLRRKIKALEEQLDLERKTVAVASTEVVNVRTELYAAKREAEERSAAENKEWLSRYEKHQKIAETALKREAAMKKRLENMAVHATLALQACERGRKAPKKGQSLTQARVMLEAGLAEEAKLAKEGAWFSMPWLAGVLAAMVGGLGGLGYLFSREKSGVGKAVKA